MEFSPTQIPMGFTFLRNICLKFAEMRQYPEAGMKVRTSPITLISANILMILKN